MTTLARTRRSGKHATGNEALTRAVKFTRNQISTYFISRLPNEKSKILHAKGAQVDVRCPCHSDDKPSLSINLNDGVSFCHGPCGRGWGLYEFERRLSGQSGKAAWQAIEAAMGIDGKCASGPDTEIEAVYPYTDARGQLLYEVVRYQGKKFRQRRPDGNGEYIGDRKGFRPLLYNLPKVEKAKIVFIAEGEKDAETLTAKLKLREKNAAGRGPYAATTNTGGAGKWNPADGKRFQDKCVVVFQDNDPPGLKHAKEVVRSVHKHARWVKLIKLPGLKPKNDVSDWLSAHSASDLVKQIRRTKRWRPGLDASEKKRSSASTGEDSSEALPRLKIVCLADVPVRKVRWFWKPYIPMGMVTMFSGDPGTGKSSLGMAIAADLTRGRRPDGSNCHPENVLYMTTENATAEVVRPRIELYGGDPARIFMVDGSMFAFATNERTGPFSLAHIDVLDRAIEECHAKFVVVDPLQAFIGAKVDLHRSNHTRPVLDGLAKLAEKHGCAIILIRHLAKQGAGKAIYSGLGSIDFTAAVRSELIVGFLPDSTRNSDPRAIVHIKSNVGLRGPSKGYRIDDKGNFEWLPGLCDVTEHDLLATPDPGKISEVSRAKMWLREELSDGKRSVAELQESAKAEGISWASIRRAQTDLRIKPRKVAGGGWSWSLPDQREVVKSGVPTEI